MANPFSLENKTILVTGASSGIGRGIALECAKIGAKLVITARNEERLKETYENLEGAGHKMIIADLSKDEDIERVVEYCPVLNGYVNSAGMPQLFTVPHINRRNLTEIINVNTMGPVLLMTSLVKNKKIIKGGSIVFIASGSGIYVAEMGGASYAASKGAIAGFVKGAVIDLAPKWIRVNTICPGLVRTAILNMATGMFNIADIEKNINKYPLRRFGKPEDIAYAAIYLLSDASTWVTGVNLPVDGGYIVL